MSDPMTPPTISPEARKCAEKVDEAQFRKHLGHIPYQDCITILSNEIQLAINTSTEALAKENAELREQLTESKFSAEHRKHLLDGAIYHREQAEQQRDVLTQKLAMVEKEGIETAQVLLMLTRQAEKVLSPEDEILNVAQQYFVKQALNLPTQPT